jgi:hypothetical protein
VALAGLLFVLGLLPLIIFNVRTGSTIHYIRDNIFSPSYYNVDNANVGENLRERVKELGSVINGETFFYLGGTPYASWRYTTIFLWAVGALGFSMLLPSRRDTKKASGPLAIWIAVSSTVVFSYLLLRFAGLNAAQWYRWAWFMALPVSILTIVLLARQQGWKAWGQIALAAICASLLFTLFVFLSWKLARWKAQWLYLAGISILLLAPWLRAREEAQKVLFPALTLAIALMASSFTPTGLLFTHLAILVPWPILVLAVTIDMIARRSGLDKMRFVRRQARLDRGWATALSLGTLLSAALAGMLIYDDLKVDTAYHHDLKRIGGIGDHTSASYALVQYLEQQEIDDVVAMDWGIQDVIQFLSEGEINAPQLSSYEDVHQEDGAFALRVREHLDHPDTVYVFHVGPVFKNRWEAFQHLAEQEGRTPVEIKIVHDRAAIPIFRLVHVP